MFDLFFKVALVSGSLAVATSGDCFNREILKEIKLLKERNPVKDHVHHAMDSVCYEYLGCFSLSGTFGQIIQTTPQTPEEVGTKFLLFSRHNRQEAQVLDYLDQNSLSTNLFSSSRNTVILIHGYQDIGMSGSRKAMLNAFLDNADCQVIIVDWRNGASGLFTFSAANSELVGRQIGYLLFLLKKNRGLDPEKVHVVGFSLGAHAAGFSGKWTLKEWNFKLGRVTALDPAWPLFNNSGPTVHVWKEDANFVDVIHTSAGQEILFGELGMVAALGHVDFYPNGGSAQPGCPQFHPDCSHLRAETLLTESIGSVDCSFLSSPCEGGKEAFLRGECPRCEGGECGQMGFRSRSASGRGILFLETNDKSPYCKK